MLKKKNTESKTDYVVLDDKKIKKVCDDKILTTEVLAKRMGWTVKSTKRLFKNGIITRGISREEIYKLADVIGYPQQNDIVDLITGTSAKHI